jgi:DNA-binding NarL/FixJ family response regulator
MAQQTDPGRSFPAERAWVPEALESPGVEAPLCIRLAIVSDVRLVRESLTRTVHDRQGISLVGSFGLDIKSVSRIAELSPDVVLIDLGHADAADIARRVKVACDRAKLVAFALAEVDDDVFACAAAGFSSYVSVKAGRTSCTRRSSTRRAAGCSARPTSPRQCSADCPASSSSARIPRRCRR